MNKKRSRFIAIDPRHCVACWKCVEACPQQVIGKVEFLWHRHVVLKHAEACIGCYRCVKTCPQQVFSRID